MFRAAAILSVCLGVALPACGGGSNPFRRTPVPPPPGLAGDPSQRDATGAVAEVPMDETQHVHTVLEILRSHVAGLQVAELPGGEIRLRLRGEQQSLRTDDASNQPLLVIDDMPVLPTTIRTALLGLNPYEIESIRVLKDVSSTAIYGSRGANGVILIQMKRRGAGS